jgi:DNA invertase Pin-like site-specific DNA recombinase
MIDAFAAYERALIRARTKAALAVKKARGERVGGIAYGKRMGEGGLLVDNPDEAQALGLARRLRREGRSLRQIGAALAQAGHAPRNGKSWHVAVLSRLVGG